MNRKELVNMMYEALVTEAGNPAYTKKELMEVIRAYEDAIIKSIGDGNNITLPGFVSFKIVEKAAREGFSHFSNTAWSKPAHKAVVIKPSSVMKNIFE